ncbi:flagellar hook-length control protein FliK [Octadecabacter sp. 1_MG-2023]|uniref:flagellar hook-length control protein FliK n=1 Tax=unclassified Octadecabacter TaxID=196158 RepID=UPI001C09F730|nr:MULTISPECIES: flagellar hook-length control protein FliK [unclassified Octadecabacter]MBU2992398.1 flagellar hook-length control protein FliK [Octadecabacter sp. B2R22]MDO6734845.1 flagellar hook-length control protein FliK [Octadecabacter sp. 1_MG-2023]
MYQHESQGLGLSPSVAGTTLQHDNGQQAQNDSDPLMVFAQVMAEQDSGASSSKAKFTPIPTPLMSHEAQNVAEDEEGKPEMASVRETERDENLDQTQTKTGRSERNPDVDLVDNESGYEKVQPIPMEGAMPSDAVRQKSLDVSDGLPRETLVKTIGEVGSVPLNRSEQPVQPEPLTGTPASRAEGQGVPKEQHAEKLEWPILSPKAGAIEMKVDPIVDRPSSGSAVPADTKDALLATTEKPTVGISDGPKLLPFARAETRSLSPRLNPASSQVPNQIRASPASENANHPKEAPSRQVLNQAIDNGSKAHANNVSTVRPAREVAPSIAPNGASAPQVFSASAPLFEMAGPQYAGLLEIGVIESGIPVGSTAALETHTANTVTPSRARAIQIAAQIATVAAQSGGGTTEIALNPEELGRVKMTLTSTDAGLSVSVLAERPETADLMRRNINDLIREFQDLGYESLEFSFQDQSPGSDRSDQDDQAYPPNSSDSPQADRTTLVHIQPATSGGLDLKL